ncbi:DUF4430 domain-containing protein [Bacillus cereus]|uniref:DUF4430 domain-containing protein n=1 Tax=Bacillus cereus TaxID=1396 RepID=UPI00065BCD33|nr:DUF4430 domain-containing protein [Bacillus cereus]KMQ32192.1 hypothetical protein TU58_01520 [Bacillus cereus]
MRKIKLMLTPLLIAMMIIIAGCQDTVKEPRKDTTSAVKIEITMDNGKEKVTKKKVDLKNQANVYDLMKENFKIEDNNGMITSIENKKQDTTKSKYWMFEVNNKPAMKGAKEYEVKAGDVITWDLHEAK